MTKKKICPKCRAFYPMSRGMKTCDNCGGTLEIVYNEINGAEYITKDSGSREECFTGAVRDVREGKGRFDLISP